jgi:hypothetical protein
MFLPSSVLRGNGLIEAARREDAVNSGNIRLDSSCNDSHDADTEWRKLNPQRIAVGVQCRFTGVVRASEYIRPARTVRARL